MATWVGKLDGGQLDTMWNYLRFTGDKPTVRQVESLEKHLDMLRTLMIQKSAGQPGREPKTKGFVDFEDLETVLNCIIIGTMELYLDGGLKMLKEVLDDD